MCGFFFRQFHCITLVYVNSGLRWKRPYSCCSRFSACTRLLGTSGLCSPQRPTSYLPSFSLVVLFRSIRALSSSRLFEVPSFLNPRDSKAQNLSTCSCSFMSRLSSAQSNSKTDSATGLFSSCFLLVGPATHHPKGVFIPYGESVDCLPSNSQEPYELEVRLGQLT